MFRKSGAALECAFQILCSRPDLSKLQQMHAKSISFLTSLIGTRRQEACNIMRSLGMSDYVILQVCCNMSSFFRRIVLKQGPPPPVTNIN
jgi:hypothetical protein